MIILVVVLVAGALAAATLDMLWTQVHPVAAIVAAIVAGTATILAASRATDAQTPTTGSARRKHDQFLAAWSAARHDTDPEGPSAAWRADHAATGVDAAEWIARHHPS